MFTTGAQVVESAQYQQVQVPGIVSAPLAETELSKVVRGNLAHVVNVVSGLLAEFNDVLDAMFAPSHT